MQSFFESTWTKALLNNELVHGEWNVKRLQQAAGHFFEAHSTLGIISGCVRQNFWFSHYSPQRLLPKPSIDIEIIHEQGFCTSGRRRSLMAPWLIIQNVDTVNRTHIYKYSETYWLVHNLYTNYFYKKKILFLGCLLNYCVL